MAMTSAERVAAHRARKRKEQLAATPPDWDHVALHIDSMPQWLRDKINGATVTPKPKPKPKASTVTPDSNDDRRRLRERIAAAVKADEERKAKEAAAKAERKAKREANKKSPEEKAAQDAKQQARWKAQYDAATEEILFRYEFGPKKARVKIRTMARIVKVSFDYTTVVAVYDKGSRYISRKLLTHYHTCPNTFPKPPTGGLELAEHWKYIHEIYLFPSEEHYDKWLHVVTGGDITAARKALGVSKDATKKEIKAAFQRKAMDKHPDRGGDHDEFVKVKQAYEVLTDALH